MFNWDIIMAAALAFFAVIIFTPYVRKLAFRIGAVDHPNQRRINKIPIPGIGGLAIVAAFWLAVIVFRNLSGQVLWIFLGATLITITGFIDDIKDLSPWLKLVLQVTAAALVVVFGGVRIDFIRLPFSAKYIGFGSLAIPITIFWIAGVTNALNFIDGLDGLAAGTAGIASTTLLIVAMQQGSTDIAILLAALVGSCFGFLRYNFNPAQIFMGDTGALTLGYLLAVISVEGLMKSATTIAIAVPVLALGLPLVDTTIAILRRVRNGKSPFHADRGHLHHRLIDRGLTQKQAVSVLYCLSLGSGFLAIVLSLGFNYLSLLGFASILGLVFVGNRFVMKDDSVKNRSESIGQ